MKTMVPPLEEMREMSDAELLALKTTISYDMGMISAQIHRVDEIEIDEDWLRRANHAQRIREHGISAIKNILMERTALRSDEPAVPLERWLWYMQAVINAARVVVDADGEETLSDWDRLVDSLEQYEQFTVRHRLADRVVKS